MAWSSGKWDAQVECPFFKWAKLQQRTITCEGIAEDSNVSMWFRERTGMEHWAACYCWKHYRRCPIYQAALEKYTQKD